MKRLCARCGKPNDPAAMVLSAHTRERYCPRFDELLASGEAGREEGGGVTTSLNLLHARPPQRSARWAPIPEQRKGQGPLVVVTPAGQASPERFAEPGHTHAGPTSGGVSPLAGSSRPGSAKRSGGAA